MIEAKEIICKMGMYTELVIKMRVREDIPAEVEAILQYLFANGDNPSLLPNHPFFKTMCWDLIGRMSSFYHIPCVLKYYEKKYLFCRFDLKNYENEIEKFLHWVMPYLEHEEGDFLGWVWYEEWEKPKFIYYQTKESEQKQQLLSEK